MELNQNHLLIFCVKLNSPKCLDKIKPVMIDIFKSEHSTKTNSDLKFFSGTKYNSEPSSLPNISCKRAN